MKGLYSIKPWFVRRLRRIEDVLVERRVSPDSLTIAPSSCPSGRGPRPQPGGALSQPLLWLLVPPLGLVRLALNALDGAVARRNGSGRPFGEVMNEIGDRLADVALVAPLAFVVGPVAAFVALTCALLASAAGSAGRAVAGERVNGGPMAKADRVAVVAVAAAAGAVSASTVPFEIAAAVIAVGSVATMAVRLVHLARQEVSAGVRR